MKKKFDLWKKDTVVLTNGEAFLDCAGEVHENEVWQSLIDSCNSDDMTAELLQVLFGHFILQLKDCY